MKNKIVTVEREFDATPADLWRALTEPELMKQWYFDLPGFKAEVGYKFEFTGGPSPEKQYKHLCEVTDALRGEKLAYTWRYDGYPGNSHVTFELHPKGKRTLLKVIHTGIDTFPADNPDFAIHNFEQGWNEIINTSLENFFVKNHK